MLRKFALALATVSSLTTAACTEQVGDGELEYAGLAELSEGAEAMTTQGAFKVSVWTEDGAAHAGENTFYVRVAMPEPGNPLADGRGIPNARVSVDAFGDASDDAEFVSANRITEQADGVYMVEGVMLSEGDWELDVAIEVGETVDDDVTFYFSI